MFKLREGTPSDTHDKLRCERCKTFVDNADRDSKRVLPKKLAACKDLVEVMWANEDASLFLAPLKPEDHDVSSETYDKAVKQPIDLGTIKAKLNAEPGQTNAYNSPSAFSKDVNRIFTNVMKVWNPGQEIADAARRLQGWWIEQWTALVPRLMSMKSGDDIEIINSDKTATEDEALSSAFVHNERGDNFQEQIGMPDEENMRHWSHHHHADTVDDPVFRAAMRGYSTVSFVFGLEVTWSLIQQRQQEEEEKQAMLELECIQEIEEEDDEPSSAGAITQSSEITEKSLCIQEKVEKIEEVVSEDLDVKSQDSGLSEVSGESDDILKDNFITQEISAITQYDDDIMQEKKDEPQSKLDACEEKKEDDHCGSTTTSSSEKGDSSQDDNNVALSSSSSPSSPEKKRTSSKSEEWCCTQCTFENKASAKKCGMCGKKKSTKKRKI